MDTSPFHAGELAIQQRVGVREQMAGAGAAGVRDHMPDQHRQFFGELPLFFIGALDEAGQPWATMLVNDAGFITTPDARTLHIAGGMLAGDPLQGQLRVGAHLGGLGLVPTTRRRNRVNGVIAAMDAGGMRVAVSQSFGNCPQYIQDRVQTPVATAPVVQVRRTAALSAEDQALIARADTFFIASANLDAQAGRGQGVDVSHRGGRPGFVRVDDERTLTSPEFVGNFFFNTLGNLLGHPRAGLLFIDFDSGDMLHVAVEAEIIWDGPQLKAFAGAEQLLRFHVREVVRNVGALPFRWSEPKPASQVARTGSWEEADRAQQAAALTRAWRPYTVTEVARESASVQSFYLEPADGLGVAAHVPGQFISLRLPGDADAGLAARIRSYTLSDAPDGRRYRISVKRDGAVSGWLHDHLAPGARIELLGPGGDFVFEHGTRRPAVLLSAGIGITPMIAMLNGLLVNGSRTRHRHAIHFFHGARNRDEQPFAEHLQTMAAGHRNLNVHIRYSGGDDGEAGDIVNWQASSGRIDIDWLKTQLPFDDYDFYLCGPAAFMQQMYDGLRGLNVADERIRFEAFGPASVRRDAAPAGSVIPHAGATQPAPVRARDAQRVPVQFARSGMSALWDGSTASLLALAESKGVVAEASCRSGQCGACAVGLLSGEVEYTRQCSADIAPGQVLLCSTVPAAGSAALTLAL
ncbi:flavohemoprotein Hmp [Janthinobacterium sp. HH01]|uniref:2Fe-2S iron-sulfur cluster-binding protein n=1 Tax=Janthinobacterium sp. HH01 TaxID=1198452 RepID=UPI0002AE9478|nr:pyridoxamine 5'-phosphate oxidase family protein [Janthinobacterium sp. HH01]ELX09559.1 flavohemoprotein Hmp [Janthinobacterium sp. HH01]